MAKKIRTFADYDAARQERELNLPQAIESKLEKIILTNARKTEKEMDLGIGVMVLELMIHPQEFMKAMVKGPQELMRLHIKKQTERLNPQAEQEATLEYFQQNMYELIVCGVSISKPYGALNDDQKQSFYARFLDNVKEFTDSKHFAHFKIRYSEIENVVRGFHPPEKEDELHIVTKITDGLCREKYITRENADTIARLLSSERKEERFPAGHHPARGRTPAPVPEQTLMRNKDGSTREERMEYLTMVLGLPRETAQSYANKVTLQQLNELHQGLDDAVGEKYACRIIQANPDVVLYLSENLLTKYLTTIQVVQGRIGSNGDKEELEKKFGLENNVEKYASLEQLLELKRQLFPETAQYHTAASAASPIPNFQVYVSRYAILQQIPIMKQRLDNLIQNGELTVGRKEHWGERSNRPGGARGRKILKNIRTELNHLFADLEYDSPGCEINFDRHILSVPERTQQLLGEIRDKAYQSQK